MNQEQDYIRDIAEIRSMMSRSTRFLSLSGWAGVMAGIYALIGAYVAHAFLKFSPAGFVVEEPLSNWTAMTDVIIVAVSVLVLSVGTAIYLSHRKAVKRGEQAWNATSRRMMASMAIPLITGGLLALVFIWKGLIGQLIPLTLIFYGLALFSAGNFTFKEVRYLGMLQACLGLAASMLADFGLLFWAMGFGVLHIVYGIYIYIKYER